MCIVVVGSHPSASAVRLLLLFSVFPALSFILIVFLFLTCPDCSLFVMRLSTGVNGSGCNLEARLEFQNFFLSLFVPL